MSNKQIWGTIILSFVLLLVLIAGGWCYGIAREVSDVLQSPAAAGKIDIDADMWFEMSKDGKLELQSLHLNRIQGEFNSKILDLILLTVND